MLNRISAPPIDQIILINAAYRADPSADKLDLGIGVYKNRAGETPIYKAVKMAEQHLLETQSSKSYVSPLGDAEFVERAAGLILQDRVIGQHATGAQTAGGTGAVRMALEVAQRAGCSRVWIPNPTWGNHMSIVNAMGLDASRYDHSSFELGVSADKALDALQSAQKGDAIILHACCQNPTGIDYTKDEQRQIVDLIKQKGLFPILDFAYLGFGKGFDEDQQFAHMVLDACDEALIALSFSKNMGLYRDRVGACLVIADDPKTIDVAKGTLASIARTMYSMPPDHGAAVAKYVMSESNLSAMWREELEEQRLHIFENRQRLCLELVKHGAEFPNSYISGGAGMFCRLPISNETSLALREKHSVYLGPGARVNLAALTEDSFGKFAALIAKQDIEMG